jgi:hypothetical protein
MEEANKGGIVIDELKRPKWIPWEVILFVEYLMSAFSVPRPRDGEISIESVR